MAMRRLFYKFKQTLAVFVLLTVLLQVYQNIGLLKSLFPAPFVRSRMKDISEHNILTGRQCEKETNRIFNLTEEHDLKDLKNEESGSFVKGGQWTTFNSSVNTSKIAIIIPFKDREEHLATWFWYMIPFLQEQHIDFRIFVIEQDNDVIFNKGILYNAGFIEAKKAGDFNCFILHDVDLLAENRCNLYQCEPDMLVHLSPAVDTLEYTLPYGNLVGGVSALEPSTFVNINGFTNTFFGWGGEDDEFSARAEHKRHTISRSNDLVGRYTMIKHKKDTSMNRGLGSSNLHGWRWGYCDGLNSVKYTVNSIEELQTYSRIKITFNGPKTMRDAKLYFRIEFKHTHWKCF